MLHILKRKDATLRRSDKDEGEHSLTNHNKPFGDVDYFKLVIFKKQKTQEEHFTCLKEFR